MQRLSRAIIILLFLFCKDSVIGQIQQPMYSQYMFNMLTINSAYAGYRLQPGFSAIYRNQWIGLPGSPQTKMISFNTPINNEKLGLGVEMINDQLGVETTNIFRASIAKRVQLTENAYLSVGLQGGVQSYRANLNSASTFVSSDPAFSQNLNGVVPTVGAGIFFNTSKFYLGLSTPNVIKSSLDLSQTGTVGVYGLNNLQLFLTSGYVFEINDDVKVKPSFLIKSIEGAPLSIDLNTNLWLKDIVGLGVSYRVNSAFVSMLEFQLNSNLRFGYAYDLSLGSLGPYNQGTHEFLLRYEFGQKNITNLVSPRYF